MEKFDKIKVDTTRYLSGVATELKRITWPERNDTVKSTLVVIVITAFFALFFMLADYVFSFLFGLILS
ncbi:MAG: preprotein translocase subunit SecE [Candidatus Dadabacteria bacterium]|nr:preprotein translocase subunit SecE [Candidatus Dadabacteria bacterium]